MKKVSMRLSKAVLAATFICAVNTQASIDGKLVLFGNEPNSYQVFDNDQMHQINKLFLDKEIRDIDASVVAKAHEKGLINLSLFKIYDGDETEYGINYHAKGKGGGPITASVAYWMIKVGGYSAVAAVGKLVRDKTKPKHLAGEMAHGKVYDHFEEKLLSGPYTCGQVGAPVASFMGEVIHQSGHSETSRDLCLAAVPLTGGVVGTIEALAMAAYTAILPLPCP